MMQECIWAAVLLWDCSPKCFGTTSRNQNAIPSHYCSRSINLIFNTESPTDLDPLVLCYLRCILWLHPNKKLLVLKYKTIEALCR